MLSIVLTVLTLLLIIVCIDLQKDFSKKKKACFFVLKISGHRLRDQTPKTLAF